MSTNYREKLNGLEVLVVEDDPNIQRLLNSRLKSMGCKVNIAANGREGLEMLLSGSPDIVVLDLRLPEVDGAAFIEEAASVWPRMGIVVVTGFKNAEEEKQLRTKGIRHILDKPLEMESLVTALIDEAEHRRTKPEETISAEEQMNHRLRLLRRLCEISIGFDDLTRSLRTVCQGISRLIDSDSVVLFGIQGEQRVLAIKSNNRVGTAFTEQMLSETMGRFGHLTNQQIPMESVQIIKFSEPVFHGAGQLVGQCFSLPIVTAEQVVGLLAIATVSSAPIPNRNITFCYHAATQLSTVMTALGRMRSLAIRDHLTGTFNRRHLELELERIWNSTQAQAIEQPISLLVLDIDHFKLINDTYGHLVGDLMLQELSALLNDEIHGSGTLCRYGGDEMVLILPDVPEHSGRRIAEKILSRIREHVFRAETQKIRITVSIGVVGIFVDGIPDTRNELIALADQALYMAKRGGRDRVCVYPHHLRERHRAAVKEAKVVAPDATARKEQGQKLDPLLVKARIVIVDDEAGICRLLERILQTQNKFEVYSATSADAALQEIRDNPGKYDLVLTDINMPGKTGFQLLDELNSIDDTIVKIIMTGFTTVDNAVESLRRGAYDFVRKPFEKDLLLRIIERGLEYRQLVLENTRFQMHLQELVRIKSQELLETMDKVKESYEFTLEALVSMLDVREKDSGQHSKRVRELALVLAREMGLEDEELDEISQAALLHDIGKIAIPDNILLKPNTLTAEEREVISRHSEIGSRILSSSSHLKRVAEIVYSHHEKYDGSGYPRGLKGEEICLGARIFAVVDAYDAMRSERVYGPAMPAVDVCTEIERCSGSHFDPQVVQAFLRCAGTMENVWLETFKNENKTPTLKD